MKTKYNMGYYLYLAICKMRTVFLLPQARIIRFPIRLRGKKLMDIGRGFVTGANCRIEVINNQGSLVIGNNVQLNDNVQVAVNEQVVIGENSLIASNVFISDHNHGNYSEINGDRPDIVQVQKKLHGAPIQIGVNVWIGKNVCILPGACIGDNSVIGANALVSGIIPPNSIAIGSPARVVKKYCYTLNQWIKYEPT